MEMPDDVKELDERRRAAQNEVDRTYRRLTKVQAAVHELAQLVADLATKEQREAALMRELEAISAGYDAARHVHVRQEMARLQALSERATRLAARAEREPLLTEERGQALTARAALDQRLGELRRQRDLALSTEADFAALRDEHEAAVAQLRAGELATVTAESEVSAADAALTLARTAERELAKRRQTLSELNGRRRLHEELDRAFTDLRTDLNFQLRPELSELASAFLAELTDGRYAELELDDQYNLIVLEDGIAKPVISGGEEDMANLVLRLAISQMIAERAGQPFSLLILDEIFGSLDEMRRASVLELLRRLHDRFEQVILITHIESVREGMDQVISVRYDEEHGASRVERLMPTGGNGSLADDGEDGRLMQTVAAAD
jgi:exonuclease SbcC